MENSELLKKISLLEDELKSRNRLINNLPCTVSWINKDLEYLSVNQELKNLFKEQLGGMDKTKFSEQKVGFLQKEGNPFFTFISDFFENNEEYADCEYSTDISGELKCHLVMAQKYMDGTQAVVIGFDVTEKKKLQDKINKDERLRLIGELSTGVIHEINTPLSVIMNYTDLIKEAIESNSKENAFKMLDRIDLMSERMNTIVQGLKNLGRDNTDAKLENTSLSKIIDEIKILTKNKLMMYRTSLEIKNTLEPDATIKCVEGQIIQVLINLIGNSCEAFEVNKSNQKNVINLIIENQDGKTLFKVIDNGPGIPSEIQDKIFKPFFSTKDKEQGTGMGLGICKEIANIHQGDLLLESSYQGTQFTLIIP